jgi:hypothetical protein
MKRVVFIVGMLFLMVSLLSATSFKFKVLISPDLDDLKKIVQESLKGYSVSDYFTYEIMTFEGNAPLPEKSLVYFGEEKKVMDFFLQKNILKDYFYLGKDRDKREVYLGYFKGTEEYNSILLEIITFFLGEKEKKLKKFYFSSER